MKWFRVISVFVVLATVSALSVGLWLKRTAALNEEEKRLFQAVWKQQDIFEAVGPLKDAAFAYGRQGTGSARKVDKHWTRTKEDGTISGSARLNVSGEKAWGQVAVYYRYVAKSGDLRITRVELEQIEVYPNGKN